MMTNKRVARNRNFPIFHHQFAPCFCLFSIKATTSASYTKIGDVRVLFSLKVWKSPKPRLIVFAEQPSIFAAVEIFIAFLGFLFTNPAIAAASLNHSEIGQLIEAFDQ